MSTYPKIHLSFGVSDLESSITFYTKFFGEDPVKIKPGYAKFLPSAAPLNLALHAGANVDGDAAHHMGIQVEDRETVLNHLQRIKAAGLMTDEEMNVDCCHANQDKFWVKDPDGREWEIYVLNRDIDEHGHGKATGCCEEAEKVAVADESASCCEPTCCN
ncbi:MAG: ArsI/CadI family heavy metal resistance metalloenzyme [Gemmatimonadota bacterium]|nr:ArsI/CadI family heavy metal resistance metalloenzyme [Gemmatimonadota bacterium]